jgi:peptidoglycan/LPS O-acetylase OafA/YrhL
VLQHIKSLHDRQGDQRTVRGEMSRHNNFDCIRLIAALLVLVSHSYALTGASDREPFVRWLGYDSGGGIGVTIFFVMSGFLVSGSVARRSTVDYLMSRIMRILPALALVTCFEVLVIGPVFTSLPLSVYFSSPETMQHLTNAAVFPVHFGLPGVFTSLVHPVVNGSLWTLPAECGLYLLLPAIAFCGGLTRRGAILAFLLCAAGYIVSNIYFGLTWESQGPEVVRGIRLFAMLKLATFFFAGSALWTNRDTVPLNVGGAIVCGGVLFAVMGTTSAQAAYFLCVPYLVIFAVLKTPVISLEKVGDLSYGTYLFAFPVQQSIVSIFGASVGPLFLTVIALPITLVLAFLSWRFVERPALRWRSRTHDERAVIAMPPLAA